jgi:putative salt-induced outer membrane protein YdiY
MSRALFAVLFASLSLVLLPSRAAAQDVFQEGTTVTIELMNGDKITGIVTDADGPKLVLQHEVFGLMEIPRAAIKPAAPAAVDAVTPWSGKFDVAMTGAEGNTDNQNLRIGVDVKHDDEEGIDTFTGWWTRDTDDGDTTAEKLYTQFRHEWKLEDTKYRPFLQASFEKDPFTDYDSRSAAAAGVAYPCLEGETHKVTSRLGGGLSYKSVDDQDIEQTNYEGLVGLDWLWKVSETQNFSFNTDVYPSINNTPEYRSVSRAAYEIKVDPASDWYIKLGVDHFYDSDPGETSRSADYNYYLGLGRAF